MKHHHLPPPSCRACARPVLALCLIFALAGAGCTSVGGTDPASFASVTITNHTATEIVQATASVFGADGFQGRMVGDGQMLFEKAASGLTTISREGLLSAQSGARTINRARVEIVNLGGGAYKLQCKAYLVTGGSDPFFQNEVALSNARSGPYKTLLNKVAKQLKKLPPTVATPAGGTVANPR